jgi:hypothetical protein
MTQLYPRNPARHGLLARQGGNGGNGGNGNHSDNGNSDPVPSPPAPTSSQATGMRTALLLPS